LIGPHVPWSATIPIAKRISLLPWIEIPAATIAFSGTACVLAAREVPPDLLRVIFRHMADNEKMIADSYLIEGSPVKPFSIGS
jgi:hypothetical protein